MKGASGEERIYRRVSREGGKKASREQWANGRGNKGKKEEIRGRNINEKEASGEEGISGEGRRRYQGNIG